MATAIDPHEEHAYLEVDLRLPVTHQELVARFERLLHFQPGKEEVRVHGVIARRELQEIIGAGRHGFHSTILPHLRAAKANGGE